MRTCDKREGKREKRSCLFTSVEIASLQELVSSLVGFVNTGFIHVSLNEREDNIRL